MLSCSYPYLQKKLSTWFSLDLDFISFSAVSFFPLQNLHREKFFLILVFVKSSTNVSFSPDFLTFEVTL